MIWLRKDYLSTDVLKWSNLLFFGSRLVDTIMILVWFNKVSRFLNKLLIPNTEITILNQIWNFTFNLRTDSRRTISERYEKELLQEFSVAKRWLYLDIGSNNGKYIIHCLKNLHFKKAVSFEPNQEILKYQKINITNNKLSWLVDVIEKWVWKEDGELPLYLVPWDTGISSFMVPKKWSYFDAWFSTSINIVSLDNRSNINKLVINEISLIKVDVEWFEYEVFLWAQNILKQVEQKTKIIVEIRHHNINKDSTINLLFNLWFTIEKVLWDDYIFIKK